MKPTEVMVSVGGVLFESAFSTVVFALLEHPTDPGWFGEGIAVAAPAFAVVEALRLAIVRWRRARRSEG